MADAEAVTTLPCQFDQRGWAPCKKRTTNGWCSEHEGLACSSCGQQATVSCDAQMGGLGCGYPLCESCRHIDGKHVTKEVADKWWADRRRLEQEGIMSEDMLRERGIPVDLKVPGSLKVLMAKGKEGYVLGEMFSLEISHGLMGYFPAIFDGTKRVIASTDPTLMIRLWQNLEPRESQMHSTPAWVNSEIGICYPVLSDTERSRPFRILTEQEYSELTKDGKGPFTWAFGLIGAQTSPENFAAIIKKAAEERGIKVSDELQPT